MECAYVHDRGGVVKKYTYMASEQTVDVRHYKIVSDKKLDDKGISEAMCLVDITKEGDTQEDHGVVSQFIQTEYGDDSQINFYEVVG